MIMYNPPHPGELIAETLEELSVSVREFAGTMSITPSTAHGIINGITAITPEMALTSSPP